MNAAVPTTDTIKPTEEQLQAMALAQRGEQFKIMAYAGSGKTTTLHLVSRTLSHRKGLYLAFNKAIAEEARGRFASNVDCRTFHSLAFRHVDRAITDKLRLPRLTPTLLARDYHLQPITLRRMLGNRYENFTLTPGRQAALISNAVSRFCATHARHPAPRHLDMPDWMHPDDAEALRTQLFPSVERRWIESLDPRHRAGISHDIYLKRWALSDPIIPVDYVLFDEAQDADPLMLGVLLRQSCQVIYVGDPHQQIYGWRGAVNAMQQMPIQDTRLTQSFRFGDAVADIANVLLTELKESVPLQGYQARRSIIERQALMTNRNAILCRSNARAMELLMVGLVRGEKVALQADTDRLSRFVQAAQAMRMGQLAHDVPELAWFGSWSEVQEYGETRDGSDLKPLIKLVDDHGPEVLKRALNRIVPLDQADYVISTAHKAKGLEWNNVQIEDDYNYKINHGKVQIAPDELRLLYVACTRAREILNIHHLMPLIGALRQAQKT